MMDTTAKPLTTEEEHCIFDAANHMQAALRRLLTAAHKGERGVVAVEVCHLRRLAETIEKGLE